MNLEQSRYTKFSLCREMLELPDVIRAFDPAVLRPLVDAAQHYQRILLTGEGSSRIFPAKNAIWKHLQTAASPLQIGRAHV